MITPRRSMLALAALAVVACGPTTATPPPLTAQVEPKAKVAAAVELDLGPLSDEPVCSKPANLEELCVDDLRTAMEHGLGKLLAGYFDDEGKRYRARFRFVEFSHGKTKEGIAVTFSWKFTLVDPDGEPVVMLSDITTGPDHIVPDVSPDGPVGAALVGVLDHIATVLNRSDLGTPTPAE